MERIDTESLFDREYFLDLLSFSNPVQWEELWKSTESGYRINAASLDCCDLLLHQEVRFQRSLVKGLIFKYRLLQQDDKDIQDFHQWLELEQDLAWGISGSFFGEPTFHKEDTDIGLGLTWRGNHWKASARHTFVDFDLNHRGLTSRHYTQQPATDQFSIGYGTREQELSASLEYDTSTRLAIPDENKEFNYRRTTVTAAWSKRAMMGWNWRMEYSYQFQVKGNRFQPDPLARSIDSRRQVHRALIALEGSLSEQDHLEAGQVLLERAARTDYANAGQSGIFYRRWETQSYARWRRIAAAWLVTDLAAYLSFGETRTRYPETPAFSSFSNIVEAKVGTGLEFVLGPSNRIEVYGNFDADNPAHLWDGGNVRAMFFF